MLSKPGGSSANARALKDDIATKARYAKRRFMRKMYSPYFRRDPSLVGWAERSEAHCLLPDFFDIDDASTAYEEFHGLVAVAVVPIFPFLRAVLVLHRFLALR